MSYWIEETKTWLSEEEYKAYKQKKNEELKQQIKEAIIDTLINQLDITIDLNTGELKIAKKSSQQTS